MVAPVFSDQGPFRPADGATNREERVPAPSTAGQTYLKLLKKVNATPSDNDSFCGSFASLLQA